MRELLLVHTLVYMMSCWHLGKTRAHSAEVIDICKELDKVSLHDYSVMGLTSS